MSKASVKKTSSTKKKNKILRAKDINLIGYDHSHVKYHTYYDVWFPLLKYIEDTYCVGDYSKEKGNRSGVTMNSENEFAFDIATYREFNPNLEYDRTWQRGVCGIGIKQFPYCCGIATAWGLGITSFAKDDENLLSIFGDCIKDYGRKSRVTQMLYAISNQEAAYQKDMIEAMGFTPYADSFISCRTNHELQVYKLDTYSEKEMEHAKEVHHATYIAESMYDDDGYDGDEDEEEEDRQWFEEEEY